MTIDVFDHDNRGIDDDPKVHGAEGQEIGRSPGQVEKNESSEHCERDIDRSDDGSAQIAKKKDQHEKHEQHSQRQVFQDCPKCRIDQATPVVIGHHLVALWHDAACVQFLGFCLDAF